MDNTQQHPLVKLSSPHVARHLALLHDAAAQRSKREPATIERLLGWLESLQRKRRGRP